MMHDVLSQYFPSIKNGANTFYINKVSTTHYSVEGFRSFKFELGNSNKILEDGLFKKSEAARCQSVSPLAEQIIQLQIGIGIIVSSLLPNQFQKPSLHSMDAGKSKFSGNYNRTA